MLFNSFPFLCLLLVSFAVFYLPIPFFRRANTQLLVLIAASVVFYGYFKPVLLILLAFSGAVNVLTSYYVHYGRPRNRFPLACAGVVINLLVLAFFKYSP